MSLANFALDIRRSSADAADYVVMVVTNPVLVKSR
jgi:hypothetical protein